MHLISRSIGRKLAVLLAAIVVLMLMSEARVLDSRFAAWQALIDQPGGPEPGEMLQFVATAYCKGTTTASGVAVRTGIAAGDPSLLPVGSVVNLSTGDTRYDGVYTIMDTGPKVQGRMLDLYIWSCHEALSFGRKPVNVTVLRLGWDPSASSPSLVDRLFRGREVARRNAPARPPTELPAGAAALPAYAESSGNVLSAPTSPERTPEPQASAVFNGTAEGTAGDGEHGVAGRAATSAGAGSDADPAGGDANAAAEAAGDHADTGDR